MGHQVWGARRLRSAAHQACGPPLLGPPGASSSVAESSVVCRLQELVSSWSRGVTVSTLDSESSDRGSNPRETCPAPAPEAPSQAESWRRGAHSGLPARGRRTCSGVGRLAMQQQPWARGRPSASSRGMHPIPRAGTGNAAVAARRGRCWWRAQCMAGRLCATVAA